MDEKVYAIVDGHLAPFLYCSQNIFAGLEILLTTTWVVMMSDNDEGFRGPCISCRTDRYNNG